jgi:hypothetical protein
MQQSLLMLAAGGWFIDVLVARADQRMRAG